MSEIQMDRGSVTIDGRRYDLPDEAAQFLMRSRHERAQLQAEVERLREAIREIEAAEDEGDRSRLLHALDRASDLVGDSRN